MTSRLKLTAVILAVALMLVGMFVSSGPRTSANSPYHSALSSLGVASAEAKSHKCTNRICEPVSPGYVCADAAGSNCVFGGGCTTVPCQ